MASFSSIGVHDSLDLAAKRLTMFQMKENVQPDSASGSPLEPTSRSSLKTISSSSSSSRPNSHHRRRSSVSTRRESAEMMGVSPAALSDLPSSDDADTDSLRKRALWALEGKSGNGSPTVSFPAFSHVEIPELTAPEMDKKPDWPLKSSFFLNSNSLLSGKRDSFGRALTPSLSAKDQLGTLVEEEEEEEHQPEVTLEMTSSQSRPKTPSTFRPLNIAPVRPGLKPLTLATSPPLASPPPNSTTRVGMAADMPKRRSSLSYRVSSDVSSPRSSYSLAASFNAMPTLEMTPTTIERPLSPSESAFLSNNHASLLSRITELERVLAVRSRSMSVETASSRQLSVSSVGSEPPSDEMLCLVRDLKAERDDLTRDIGVWQTRVEDLEKQIGVLTRRVENERRDAWQAREKVGLLEVEKAKIQQALNEARAEMEILRDACVVANTAKDEVLMSFRLEQQRRESAEYELSRQQKIPRIKVGGVHSTGSTTSSATDVDFDIPLSVVSLKPVREEEDEDHRLDDDDELAHYEDEDDDDIYLCSDDSFSDTNTRSSLIVPPGKDAHPSSLKPSYLTVAPPLPSPSSIASTTPPPTPSPLPMASHSRKSSLEQSWSFPKGAQPTVREQPEVDRFFECLDWMDRSPDSPLTSTQFPGSDDKRRFGFFRDDDEDEDFVPFVIPAQQSSYSVSLPLDIVIEEDEEEDAASTPSLLSSIFAPVGPLVTKRKPVPSLGEPTSSIFSPTRRLGSVFTPIPGNAPMSPTLSSPLSPMSGGSVSRSLPSPTFSRDAPSPQTPRKVSPSSIPKLSPSTSNTYVSSQLATPTSLPRVKGSNEPLAVTSKRQSNAFQGSTPTKLPVSKMSNSRAQSASPLVENAALLKSSSTLSALASFLPWNKGWTNVESSNSEGDELIRSRDIKLSHDSVSLRTPVVAPQVKKPTAPNSRPGKPRQLVLL